MGPLLGYTIVLLFGLHKQTPERNQKPKRE